MEYINEYEFSIFWKKFNEMMNKVIVKYNLTENPKDHNYYNNNNWHIIYNDFSHPQFDENELCFEIINDTKSYLEFCKNHSKDLEKNITILQTKKYVFLHIHNKSFILGESKYHLTENIDTFMNKIQQDLEENINQLFKNNV